MTKSQIDRLGARLRSGEVSDADLRMLDEYRESFASAYDQVMRRLRDEFGLSPTGRAAKSTFAILGKLRRESVRLSPIQDVAGCRVVGQDVAAQDDLVGGLRSAFEPVAITDRRERPSHGYRAVHLIVTVDGRAVEVQVRTIVQQLWAEVSEVLSDRFGLAVKYGGGAENLRAALASASDAVGQVETLEMEILRLRQQTNASPEPAMNLDELGKRERALELIQASLRQALRRMLTSLERIE